MYCILDEIPSPSVDGLGMVLDDYDGQMISEDKYDLNFLTFGIPLRENPGKEISIRKLTRPEFEPGLAR